MLSGIILVYSNCIKKGCSYLKCKVLRKWIGKFVVLVLVILILIVLDAQQIILLGLNARLESLKA